MKKKVAKAVISLVVIIPVIFFLVQSFLLFSSIPTVISETKMADEVFKSDIDSYSIVIDYLKTVIEENPGREQICLLVGTEEKGKMYLSDVSKQDGKLDFTEEVNNALVDIDDNFGSNPEFTFESIRIKDGCIAFETIDGRYTLIYALDENVNKKSIKNGEPRVYVTKAADNWYHKVREG